MKISFVLQLAIVIASMSMFSRPVACQDHVSRAWDLWQKRNQSMTGIAYEAKGKAGVTKGAWTDMLGAAGPIPLNDHISDVSLAVSIDLANRRSAKHATQILYSTKSKQVEQQHYVNLYDGVVFQTFVPRDFSYRLGAAIDKYSPDIRVKQASSLDTFFDPNDLPILMSLAIMPKNTRYPSPLDFKLAADKNDFVFTSNATVDGREHTILRTQPASSGGNVFCEYWVDLDRQGVVSRHVLFANDTPKFQCDIKYVEQEGLWLVDEWKCVTLQSQAIERWQEFKVHSRTINPTFSLADFHVEPVAGQIVQNDASSTIVVKGDPGNPDENLRSVIDRDSGNGFPLLWVGGFAALILLLITAMRFRRQFVNLIVNPRNS